MITFAEMQRRLQRLNVNSISVTSIEDTKEILINEQRSQMNAGLLATGSKIEPPYAQSTVRRKLAKGQETSFVNLQDTGDMKAGIFVKVNPDSYIIDSTRKVESGALLSVFLERKYGPSIWGIGGDYRSRYIRALRETMQLIIQKEMS